LVVVLGENAGNDGGPAGGEDGEDEDDEIQPEVEVTEEIETDTEAEKSCVMHTEVELNGEDKAYVEVEVVLEAGVEEEEDMSTELVEREDERFERELSLLRGSDDSLDATNNNDVHTKDDIPSVLAPEEDADFLTNDRIRSRVYEARNAGYEGFILAPPENDDYLGNQESVLDEKVIESKHDVGTFSKVCVTGEINEKKKTSIVRLIAGLVASTEEEQKINISGDESFEASEKMDGVDVPEAVLDDKVVKEYIGDLDVDSSIKSSVEQGDGSSQVASGDSIEVRKSATPEKKNRSDNAVAQRIEICVDNTVINIKPNASDLNGETDTNDKESHSAHLSDQSKTDTDCDISTKIEVENEIAGPVVDRSPSTCMEMKHTSISDSEEQLSEEDMFFVHAENTVEAAREKLPCDSSTGSNENAAESVTAVVKKITQTDLEDDVMEDNEIDGEVASSAKKLAEEGCNNDAEMIDPVKEFEHGKKVGGLQVLNSEFFDRKLGTESLEKSMNETISANSLIYTSTAGSEAERNSQYIKERKEEKSSRNQSTSSDCGASDILSPAKDEAALILHEVFEVFKNDRKNLGAEQKEAIETVLPNENISRDEQERSVNDCLSPGKLLQNKMSNLSKDYKKSIENKMTALTNNKDFSEMGCKSVLEPAKDEAKVLYNDILAEKRNLVQMGEEEVQFLCKDVENSGLSSTACEVNSREEPSDDEKREEHGCVGAFEVAKEEAAVMYNEVIVAHECASKKPAELHCDSVNALMKDRDCFDDINASRSIDSTHTDIGELDLMRPLGDLLTMETIDSPKKACAETNEDDGFLRPAREEFGSLVDDICISSEKEKQEFQPAKDEVTLIFGEICGRKS